MSKCIEKRMLVLDLVPYFGGSKVAAKNILQQNSSGEKICVLTSDEHTWRDTKFDVFLIKELVCFKNKEYGYLYFLKHIFIAVQVIYWALRLGNCKKIIGISGPGVDLSMYLSNWLVNFEVIQLVQGPIACSRTNARALTRANKVIYLPHTKKSINRLLNRVYKSSGARQEFNTNKYKEFINGITNERWPSQVSESSQSLLWCASLLKWKGAELFNRTIESDASFRKYGVNFCFIKPNTDSSRFDEPPRNNEGVNIFESPHNLDDIRRSSSIFVSTSINEPFGLSILESLAAGLVVVIPEDGAYWDLILKDRVNCIKYNPEDDVDLCKKLSSLISNRQLVKRISLQGRRIAEKYRAEKVYKSTIEFIQS